jgi:hypothetical protein
VVLAAVVTGLLAGGAVSVVGDRSIRDAGTAAAEEVASQLAGDVQAAFDPATLRPATNPTGAEYAVVGPDGIATSTSDLPLGVRIDDVVADPRAALPDHAVVEVEVAAADGTAYIVIAAVPLAIAERGIDVVARLAALVVVGVVLVSVAAATLLVRRGPAVEARRG